MELNWQDQWAGTPLPRQEWILALVDLVFMKKLSAVARDKNDEFLWPQLLNHSHAVHRNETMAEYVSSLFEEWFIHIGNVEIRYGKYPLCQVHCSKLTDHVSRWKFYF